MQSIACPLNIHTSAVEPLGVDPTVCCCGEVPTACFICEHTANTCAPPAAVPAAFLRHGVINLEYDFDASDTEDDSLYDASSIAGDAAFSPRTARLLQQQQQQAQAKAEARKGPKVLKPEGAALLRPATPTQAAGAAASGQSRAKSPSRPITEPYQLPTQSDDLDAVVRTFLQHEVLNHGRRSKLAGSSLGLRRAKDKAPAFQGWQILPAGSHL